MVRQPEANVQVAQALIADFYFYSLLYIYIYIYLYIYIYIYIYVYGRFQKKWESLLSNQSEPNT